MFSFLRKLFQQEELDYTGLQERGAIVIDVRTPGEYAQGHVPNSLNIPLDRIERSIDKIKGKNKPIITCCRSGARSGRAADILKADGVEVYNGGSWNQVSNAIK